MINKTKCAHCQSSQVEFYGVRLFGLHSYYKCLVCHKFTEYYLPFKYWLIMNLITLLVSAIAIATFFFLLDLSSTMAVAFALTGLLLLSILCYKYRWFGYKTIFHESLPNGTGIIRAFMPKRFRIIIVIIFFALLIGYFGIAILNLARQR
jgi:hypothetical protein